MTARGLHVHLVDQARLAATGRGVARRPRRVRGVLEVARHADHRDLARLDVHLHQEHHVGPAAPAPGPCVRPDQQQVEPAVVAPGLLRIGALPGHRGPERGEGAVAAVRGVRGDGRRGRRRGRRRCRRTTGLGVGPGGDSVSSGGSVNSGTGVSTAAVPGPAVGSAAANVSSRKPCAARIALAATRCGMPTSRISTAAEPATAARPGCVRPTASTAAEVRHPATSEVRDEQEGERAGHDERRRHAVHALGRHPGDDEQGHHERGDEEDQRDPAPADGEMTEARDQRAQQGHEDGHGASGPAVVPVLVLGGDDGAARCLVPHSCRHASRAADLFGWR